MLDYHIHSHFSADCEAPMEAVIQAAIEKGLTEICFTEHIDYEYPDPSIVFEFDLKHYDQTIRHFQNMYDGRIKVKKGIEIGVQPHLLERYETLMEEEVFDFVICSMHTVARQDLHSKAFFKGKTIEEAHEVYYEELLDCVRRFKGFNVLGHVDLIKRYSERPSEKSFQPVIRDIFKEIIADGKGIELNTSGTRYGLNSGMPSCDILQLYKDSGGEIITLGSDAHTEKNLGYDFQNALILLRDIGFRFVASFDGGEPEFHTIEKLIQR
ncbi:Histidinol-phosphatase [Lentibacillus sp. JNUCC-1]|uniref:histidinol-phosphatase HisJ family protein n=1 Tax=Lentibacillus sp. JNUCC-1 TaxID=2654513 RepID=UPI0012E88423|nr:histidinol-phosphatase HisJ family protein [Lentibacillus sp. JNUCC-1]MUV38623.1 Histidinol-phosphatase [Lentibacillus sp. JNUCC-1]